MLDCLSIVVAKLNNVPYPIGGLPDPTDNTSNWESYFEEYVILRTITKCNASRELVYDEGDNRILYHNYTVEIEAILTSDQDYGPFITLAEEVGDPPVFSQILERISNFLANQGIAINFSKFPTSIRNLVPGNEDNIDPQGNRVGYTGYHGWLFDNFNGPKVDAVRMEHMVGEGAVRLNWTLRFKTFHTDTPIVSEPLLPKISSELRMDIDQDGDIAIFVDGTVYADSIQALYRARDVLDITIQPTKKEEITVRSRGQLLTPEKFAMVNGFHKTVKFNVEKNGRSARFSVVYTQVKSNNAFPLGIRNIEFTQSIESSLQGGSVYSGKGFQSWKMSFKGKVTLPPRMNPEYAWYVFHLLLQQQMRNTLITFDSKVWKADNNQLVTQELEVDGRIIAKRKYARCLPLKLKITHSHYSRELSFEVDYVVLCPISYILAVSCILNRVNNDYQRRLNQNPLNLPGQDNYKPLRLSEQWWLWNRSIDPSYGFDPESPDAYNPYSSNRPHRDVSGTEIFDTGHRYDPYKALEDQARQKHILITTVFDPNEFDKVYQTKDTSDASQSGYYKSDIPGNFGSALEQTSQTTGSNAPVSTQPNNWKGIPPFSPISLLTNSRGETPEFDPKMTWIKYEQDYEIIESNGSIPVEGLSQIDQTFYQNKTLQERYANPDPSTYALTDMPNQEVGTKFHGRTSNTKRDSQNNITGYDDISLSEWNEITDEDVKANSNVVFRKTYAASPTRYFIVVRGVAMRVKYKIPMPQVISIAGAPAIRVGEGRFRHKNVAPDADLPVYMAMWEQTYTVDKTIVSEDILSSIVDTGASMLYA
jgi:hypothetical protein